MLFKNVCIESIAHYLPEEVVTSEKIESWLAPVYERLKLPFGRLEMMTGIRERKFWKPGTVPSEVSAQAGKLALEKSGISKDSINCLVHSSVCRDFMEPATASVVHEKLELSDNSMVFDLSNACLGFLDAMVVVGNMIESGIIKSALVVAGENGRPLVESTIDMLLHDENLTRETIKASFPSLTIGCGAAAAVLVHSSISKAKHQLLGGSFMASSKFSHLCQGGSTAPVAKNITMLMKTEAETLLQAGCQLARRTWEETKNTLKFTESNVKRFFCHQVGKAHRKLMFETLGIDLEKDFSTFEFLGNMGAVSLPVTLSMGVENNLVRSGDLIALLGIGSGINCMMLGIKW
ncbi:MAG: 3-oxoacyl-ACP synthase III [Candidatus Wallbacteria bacterium]|nr:3-oxoacyl-ACP synthase III [Candidatus Wallbacteria bacterium]